MRKSGLVRNAVALMVGQLVFGVAIAAPPAEAQTIAYALDIPAQSLDDALQALALASKHELLYSAKLVNGMSSAPLKGKFTTEEAVGKLLTGTDLEYEVGSDGVVVIRGKKGTLPAKSTSVRNDAADTRLAQADPSANSSSTSASSTEEDQGLIANLDSEANSQEKLEEIVVTGTHIRGSQVAAPVLAIDREYIQKSGVATLPDLMETLPQNFGSLSVDGNYAYEGGQRIAINNNGRVSGVDLRGLGAESTLTLVNGRRLAGSLDGRVTDISLIPIAAIERVEVVTGGRSAIYGSDAVAGVANFITRRDFSGAETQLAFGGRTDGKGGERLQASQVVGLDTDRYGFLAAYNYSRDWALNLAKVGLLSLTPRASGSREVETNTQADTQTHSFLLSGRFALSDVVALHADALYATRNWNDRYRTVYAGATNESFTNSVDNAQQYNVDVGAQLKVSSDWSVDLSASHGGADHYKRDANYIDFGSFAYNLLGEDNDQSALTTVSAIANGPFISLGRISPKIAFGVESRKEEFETNYLLDGSPYITVDKDRTIRSAFTELSIPLVERAVGYFEISLAGRYDDYDDFGDTFNPQAGAVWVPIAGLTVRGAYSEAFRAPSLIELRGVASGQIYPTADPTQNGTAAPVLYIQGDAASLDPETARTWSIGIDYQPPNASWTKLSLAYFDIAYKGRIDPPLGYADLPFGLERESRFPGLVTRNPTPEQIDAAVALVAGGPASIYNGTGTAWNPATQPIGSAFPDLVLFDARTNNIAVEKVRGVDLGFDGKVAAGSSMVEFGVNASFTLDHERAVTAQSPKFDALNEVGKPVDFRARAHVGWSKGPLGALAFVNYTDSYSNPYSTPASRMASWTTVDLALRFDGAGLAGHSTGSGYFASLSVENLLNRKPPRFENSLGGLLYDATNASSRGRYISVNLLKRW